MGLNATFDVGEFGRLSKELDLQITGIKHKTTVEVTVDGTEGAAATGIVFQCIHNLNFLS